MDVWIAAFTLGLAGSLHCLGMCSPLLLAVTAKRKPVTLNKALYNAGRILTYGVLGIIVSSIGFLLNINLLQKYFSVVFGIALIVFGVVGLTSVRIPLLTPAINQLTTSIKVAFSKFLSNGSVLSVMGLGMLNGLLPCGLTYMALVYTVTLTPLYGFLYMIVFGAATLPVMLGFTSALSTLMNRFQLSTRNVMTTFLIIAGVSLVARSYIVMAHEHKAEGEQQITICE